MQFYPFHEGKHFPINQNAIIIHFFSSQKNPYYPVLYIPSEQKMAHLTE